MEESEMGRNPRAKNTSQANTRSGENLFGSKASEIKAALIAAQNLAASQDALREQAALFRPRPPQRSPLLRANQRAAERLLTSALDKSGFDFAKFGEIQAQNRAESRRIVEVQQSKALKHSAEAKATFRSAVDSRRRILEQLSPADAVVVLDTPFTIGTTPPGGGDGFHLDTYHIEPWNSWVKYKIDSNQNGGNFVNFYFFWENPSRLRPAAINIDAWLWSSGFCKADIPNHWYDYEKAAVSVNAVLGLQEWWNRPITSPPIQLSQVQEAMSPPIVIEKPFSDEVPTPQGEYAFRWCDVRYNEELVPPGGTLVILVSSYVGWEAENGGGIEADFDSGDFEVFCPFVQIQIQPSQIHP
jgi:hypothetical protein